MSDAKLVEGAAFRALRKAAGLTQETAGAMFRVSARSIRNWEAGRWKIEAEAMAAMARAAKAEAARIERVRRALG